MNWASLKQEFIVLKEESVNFLKKSLSYKVHLCSTGDRELLIGVDKVKAFFYKQEVMLDFPS